MSEDDRCPGIDIGDEVLSDLECETGTGIVLSDFFFKPICSLGVWNSLNDLEKERVSIECSAIESRQSQRSKKFFHELHSRARSLVYVASFSIRITYRCISLGIAEHCKDWTHWRRFYSN